MKTKENIRIFLLSLLSRKFLLALVGAIVAFGNSMWNWGLETAEVMTILAPILAFIGVEGWADAKERGLK